MSHSINVEGHMHTYRVWDPEYPEHGSVAVDAANAKAAKALAAPSLTEGPVSRLRVSRTNKRLESTVKDDP